MSLGRFCVSFSQRQETQNRPLSPCLPSELSPSPPFNYPSMTESILKILSLLSERDLPGQIPDHTAGKSFLKDTAPALRLFTALWCILLCALSHNAVFVLGVLAVELVRLALLPAKSLLRVLKRVFPPVLFSLLILLPGFFLGHPRTMLTISMKVLTTVLILAILNEDLRWQQITASFHALHVPQVFILTLDMTVRFLDLMGRMSQAMYEAVTLRTVSSRGKQYDRSRMKAAGGILGTVFLRSEIMAAEVAEAMECRCFDGTFRIYEKHKRGPADYIYALLIPLLLATFLLTGR